MTLRRRTLRSSAAAELPSRAPALQFAPLAGELSKRLAPTEQMDIAAAVRQRRAPLSKMVAIASSVLIVVAAFAVGVVASRSGDSTGRPAASSEAVAALTFASPTPTLPAPAVPSPAAKPQSVPATGTGTSPGATATASPSAQPPSSAAAPFVLPRNPQLIVIAFNAAPGSCGPLTDRDEGYAVFTARRGGLAISGPDGTAVGTLRRDGTFDAAGVDPFTHWSGRLTAAGGAALYEIQRVDGCTQRFNITITFG
jgi:hypothetical protein